MIWAFDGKIGGVGKSVAAAACVERLASIGEFAVIEADVNNNLASYTEGLAKKVWQVDLLSSSGWLDLASALEAETSAEIVLSLPAGSDTAGHAAIIGDVLAETKRQMALVWMMNRTPESVALLGNAVAAFAKSPVKLVAARNLFFGAHEKFAIWDGSSARKAFLKAGGTEIDFPELDDSVIEATFCAHPKVRFAASTGLAYGHRWALRRWLDETAALYASVAQKKAAAPVAVSA
jgi:hypothetical protein